MLKSKKIFRKRILGYLSLSTMIMLNLGVQDANADIGTSATGANAHAIGFYTVASGDNSTAIGDHAQATGEASFAGGYYGKASGKYSVAWGENGNISTAGAQGQASTSFGYGTTAAGDYSTSFGQSTQALGKNSTTWGELTKADGENSTAFGKGSEAVGETSTAFGQYTVAKGKNATAFGDYAHTDGENATAFGHRTQANAKNATAFGNETEASGENSTAFGNNNDVTGKNATGFGDSTQANGENSTAFGNLTNANAKNATAFGSSTLADAENAMAIGSASNAKGVNSLAGGNETAANGANSLAFGLKTLASSANAVAFGTSTQATNTNAIAGGNGTAASGVNSLAFGNSTSASGENSLSLGNGTRATGANSIAAGIGSVASGRNSVAVNANSTASGNNSFAAMNGKSEGDYSLAMGQGSNAKIANTYAIGTNATTTALNTVAFGNEAHATAQNATALGNGNTAGGASSVAVGDGNNVSGANSGALGTGNTVAQANTYAIGNSITTTQANSVVLGNGSTDRAATTESTAAVNGLTYSGFAGQGSAINGVVSIGKAGAERQLINVAAGKIAADSTDAVNGSQLYTVANTVGNVANSTKNILGGNATVAPDGTLTMSNIGDTGENTIHDAIKAAYNKEESVVAGSTNVTVTQTATNATGGKEYKVDIAKDLNLDSVTTGNSKLNTDGLTIVGGPSVTVNGIDAGNKKITNVATGTDLTDAVNVAQLRDEIAANKTLLVDGHNTTVEGDGTQANPYKVNVKDDLVLGQPGANGKDGSIGVNGVDGSAVVINGKDGSIGMNGANGQDGLTMKAANGQNGVDGTDGNGGTNGMTRIVYTDNNNVTHEVATLDDGMKYGGDTGTTITKKLNQQVNVIGGITDESKLTTTDNIGVVSDGADNLKVRLAKDLTGLSSVTLGDTKITSQGLTIQNGPSVTVNGIDAGDKKITNVANGDVSANSKDAINGSQLFQVKDELNSKFDGFDNRMNKVGAGAAALAALHPLDFDPDDKWNIAAGFGNYRNANSLALGAFYRPNEATMISVAGSMGNGENMINAGVSLKLGQSNNVTNSKVAMAKEIQELKATVNRLVDQNEKMMNAMNALGVPNVNLDVNFPDVSENHWAYNYVKTLADKGLLIGYPDGEFKGDRTMTRYEFAAVIFRALQNGAPVDGDMARAMNEFEKELEKVQKASRFRVDRVAGENDDRHKIERVRVNNRHDEANNEYRDVYGSYIPSK